ncbi:MAG: response regulator [Proteobacteria bacterium]|nr:response regulator [Pseudomonadota bacterium]
MVKAFKEASAQNGDIDTSAVILVVDDEALVRLTVTEYLRASGFEIIEAASGDEAAMLLAGGVAVDLVFSDVRMPGRLDGFGLARWVYNHRPDVPVLLTSGYSGAVSEAASQLAHVPLLAKPYRYDVLLEQLEKMLRDRSNRR